MFKDWQGFFDNEPEDIEGNLKHAQFLLDGYLMMANDSSMDSPWEFNESVSLVVECETQEEIDHFWDRLSDGGSEQMCGWLTDRFGFSWQIVPAVLGELMSDPAKSEAVTAAFLKMKKFDIQSLVDAAESASGS